MTGPDGTSRHEVRDVGIRGVLLAAAGVLALTLLALGTMRPLLGYYIRREARVSPPPSPLAERHAPTQPPAPRLQADPLRDLAALRAVEAAQLHGYGWVDRPAGRVRIPIERAIELLASDGERAP